MKKPLIPGWIKIVAVIGGIVFGAREIEKSRDRARNAETRAAEESRIRKIAEQEVREAQRRENAANQRALKAENNLREVQAKKTEDKPPTSRKPKGKPLAPRKTEFPVQ